MSQIKDIRIQSLVGTAAEWEQAKDSILLAREVGYELDTCRYKIGDGITPWSELPYACPQIQFVTWGDDE